MSQLPSESQYETPVKAVVASKRQRRNTRRKCRKNSKSPSSSCSPSKSSDSGSPYIVSDDEEEYCVTVSGDLDKALKDVDAIKKALSAATNERNHIYDKLRKVKKSVDLIQEKMGITPKKKKSKKKSKIDKSDEDDEKLVSADMNGNADDVSTETKSDPEKSHPEEGDTASAAKGFSLKRTFTQSHQTDGSDSH